MIFVVTSLSTNRFLNDTECHIQKQEDLRCGVLTVVSIHVGQLHLKTTYGEDIRSHMSDGPAVCAQHRLRRNGF